MDHFGLYGIFLPVKSGALALFPGGKPRFSLSGGIFPVRGRHSLRKTGVGQADSVGRTEQGCVVPHAQNPAANREWSVVWRGGR
jgi:hypothetical protein